MATTSLARAQADRFRRDGFLAPVPALDEAEVRRIVDWLVAFESGPGSSRKERREAYLRLKPHLLFPELHAIVRHPRILDVIESLIGPDILVWSSSFMIKDPEDGVYASWHQDSHTATLHGDQLISAWIALEDVGPENGSMRIIPGSHLQGPRPHRTRHDHANLVIAGEHLADELDEDAAIHVELRAGEMSLHHVHVVHGSPPNQSRRSRIGFVVRYFPAWMSAQGGLSSALLVRGEDPYGLHAPESAPVSHQDPATIEAWRKALQLRRRRISSRAR